MKSSSLLLGAHISIAGGIEKSIERAVSIGCTCFQIFTKSNKQWHAKPIGQEAITTFKQLAKDQGFNAKIAVHASYLINIGSPNKLIHEKSYKALKIELERAESLAIPYLVLHPGAAIDSEKEECLKKISSTLNKLLQKDHKAMILLENTAGQGSSVGYSFDQLAEIYNNIDHKNSVGFCIDTCHAFAAGYDFSTEKSYQNFWSEFDQKLGIKKLKVIHLNDSKKERGSRIDRHEDIGKGKIGLQSFKLLINDPQLKNVLKILETPKKNGLVSDKKNMEIVESLLK